jgi:hypothetical protein
MTTKREWFAAFRYIVPADFENWLEAQAREGWFCERVGQWSSIRMTFQKGEPAKYRYVADVQVHPRPDYLSTYEDAGWERVGQMASETLWRRKYEGERPEAFTDDASERARTLGFAGAAGIAAGVMAVGGLAALWASRYADMRSGDARQMLAAGIVFEAIAVAIAYAALRIRAKRER